MSAKELQEYRDIDKIREKFQYIKGKILIIPLKEVEEDISSKSEHLLLRHIIFKNNNH